MLIRGVLDRIDPASRDRFPTSPKRDQFQDTHISKVFTTNFHGKVPAAQPDRLSTISDVSTRGVNYIEAYVDQLRGPVMNVIKYVKLPSLKISSAICRTFDVKRAVLPLRSCNQLWLCKLSNYPFLEFYVRIKRDEGKIGSSI